MNVQQVIHELALAYAKAQYAEFQQKAPPTERNNVKDPYKLLSFYMEAYDVLDPQRHELGQLINQGD